MPRSGGGTSRWYGTSARPCAGALPRIPRGYEALSDERKRLETTLLAHQRCRFVPAWPRPPCCRFARSGRATKQARWRPCWTRVSCGRDGQAPARRGCRETRWTTASSRRCSTGSVPIWTLVEDGRVPPDDPGEAADLFSVFVELAGLRSEVRTEFTPGERGAGPVPAASSTRCRRATPACSANWTAPGRDARPAARRRCGRCYSMSSTCATVWSRR